VITIPLTEMDNALHESSTDFFLLVTFITGLMVIFLFIFTRKKIQDPINAIIKASEAVTAGDTNMRLKIKPKELYDMRMVSTALNQMLDSLQAANKELQNWSQQLEYKVQKKSEELGAAQNELIHIERIASLGKLSLSVAHEINNPLSGILIYTKLVSKQIGNQELDPEKKESILKHLRLIETETKRCGDIVKGLLDFSKSDQKDFEAANLHEILRKTAELMNHPMKIKNISFLTDYAAASDLIHCCPNQIKQACIAILVNASEAISENGEVVLRTINPDNAHVRIEISDNGVGIAPENISHVFEPFFSTKHSASGIGLGLAIVHGIVQGHKGKIDLKSEPGKGTTFSITLPLIQN
jgi:two-component system NtrC family sensor kinase